MPDKNTIGGFSIAEIVAQTKHLEITARKLVSDHLQSSYKSSFRGRGMEFDEVRAYAYGDDVRDIDWNVTARMNEPFIKTYIEERRLTTFFLADISASHSFGTIRSKRSLMAEITALLGFTSFFAGDTSGLVLFSDDIEKVVPPAHSYAGILRIVRDVFMYEGKSKKTNLDKALRGAFSMLKKRAVIFVLSDFFDHNYFHSLGILSRRHEVIPIVLRDRGEEKLSFNGVQPIITELEDLESGETRLVSLTGAPFARMGEYQSYYRDCFRKLGLDFSEISSEDSVLPLIERLLKKRGGIR